MVIRSDSNYRAGGTLIAYNNIFKAVRRIDIEGNFEAVWLEIAVNTKNKILLGNIYLSPNTSVEKYAELTSLLDPYFSSYNGDIILRGDFNLVGVDWNLYDSSPCSHYVKAKPNICSTFFHLRTYIR